MGQSITGLLAHLFLIAFLTLKVGVICCVELLIIVFTDRQSECGMPCQEV